MSYLMRDTIEAVVWQKTARNLYEDDPDDLEETVNETVANILNERSVNGAEDGKRFFELGDEDVHSGNATEFPSPMARTRNGGADEEGMPSLTASERLKEMEDRE